MLKNIVVFSSHGPGNLQTVLDFCREVAVARVGHLICDRDGIPSLQLAAKNGIPASVIPIPGRLIDGDRDSHLKRISALQPVIDRLCAIETEDSRIDLIVLAFRKVLTGPILNRFGDRMINVHPSDLSVHNLSDRGRRYVGIGGLKQAIADGNEFTRTSVHRIDHGVDTGELLCLGPAVRFHGDRTCEHAIAEHEERQKLESDRVALSHVLHSWSQNNLSECAVL